VLRAFELAFAISGKEAVQNEWLIGSFKNS
jgi:hypothetical protein